MYIVTANNRYCIADNVGRRKHWQIQLFRLYGGTSRDFFREFIEQGRIKIFIEGQGFT